MEKTKSKKKQLLSPHEFINIGLGCHALCVLNETNVLSELNKNNGASLQTLVTKAENSSLIRGALVTLVGAKVLKVKDQKFYLTDLGLSLIENIGAVLLPFKGYNQLFAKQYELLHNPKQWSDSEIDYQAIAESSINFGIHHLDPVLIDLVKELHPKGTICDLGCGTAEKLVKVCKAIQVSGLGFERDHKVVDESKEYTKNTPNVEVIEADITKLDGIWEDVELGIISAVLHDIEPESKCISFLNSLRDHFPRMQGLIVVDIVSMSDAVPTNFPGFDYVHGLQGVSPRTYEETMNLFTKSQFSVRKDIAVPHMPNMYIWVLEMN
jgi:hypothetical protein